eukprot:TRINITY_DN1557_c0_g3_i4.p1 TRINITY_DN1557_c0_g3~~TRINITY_DN1557_c0_g3_i4.p1  ORF type:complete len:555 (+),score=53.80 TRINITY_DN1557_c0_g3_i4:173-1837(+)
MSFPTSVVFIFGIVLAGVCTVAAADPDVPGPSANLEEIRSCSLILPLDSKYQSNSTAYHLHVYGLVNHLLWNSIPVKWAIKAGKSYQDADFSAMVDEISINSTSSLGQVINGSISASFRASSFIVPVLYADIALTLMESYITANGLRPYPVRVYSLKATTYIDIRYTLRHKPYIGVSGTTTNALIHTMALDSAGFQNLTHYRIVEVEELQGAASELCVTLLTEPHFQGPFTNNSAVPFVQSMHEFVSSGGNFIAQCGSIATYENCGTSNFSGQAPSCPPGFFLTTGGLNAPVYFSAPTKVFFYHNADLAIMQTDGDWTPPTGSVALFDVYRSASLTTQLKPNGYFAVQYGATSGASSNTSYTLAGIKTSLGAPGSNVFYVGGHILSGTVNIRSYFNAIFVPPTRPSACAFTFDECEVWGRCSGQNVACGCSATCDTQGRCNGTADPAFCTGSLNPPEASPSSVSSPSGVPVSLPPPSSLSPQQDAPAGVSDPSPTVATPINGGGEQQPSQTSNTSSPLSQIAPSVFNRASSSSSLFANIAVIAVVVVVALLISL